MATGDPFCHKCGTWLNNCRHSDPTYQDTEFNEYLNLLSTPQAIKKNKEMFEELQENDIPATHTKVFSNSSDTIDDNISSTRERILSTVKSMYWSGEFSRLPYLDNLIRSLIELENKK